MPSLCQLTHRLPRLVSRATTNASTAIASAKPTLTIPWNAACHSTVALSSKISSSRSFSTRISSSRNRPSFTTNPFGQRRTVTTIVRRPEQPEEPEVYKEGEPTIVATERAVQQLRKVAERENNPKLSLRVAVEPGGCHGYQYKLEITEEMEQDDFQFQVAPGISILVDSISLTLVKGSTIDYVTELIGSQFAIHNNPQSKGAGCGCGVSWEPIL